MSIAGGVIMLAWPGPTLFVVAVFLSWFLSWFLVVLGTIHVIDAFARMGECYWWLRLVQGVIELFLGGWAHGDHIRSLFVLVNLAGAFATFNVFQLRQVDQVVKTVAV